MKLVSAEAKAGAVQGHLGRYALKNGAPLDIHYSCHKDIRLPDHFDHFFIAGAAMAFVVGEDYEHPYPVCETLFRNIRALIRQWNQWYPEKRVISLSASTEKRVFKAGRAPASFFSGGVDSVFTTSTLGDDIKALITVAHAADDDTDIARGYSETAHLTPYADATGRRHFVVATNLMTALPAFYDSWMFIGHGAAGAAAAQFCSQEVESAVVSSSFSYGQLFPWGSHPLTDPLGSSKAVKVIHYGCAYNRIEKTEAIIKDDLALAHLTVCGYIDPSRPHINCSDCQKCARTMITLDLLGVDRAKASTFDWSHYAPEIYGRVLLRGHSPILFAEEIHEAAKARGREDIAGQTAKALRRSRGLQFLTSAEFFLRRRAPWAVRQKTHLKKLRTAVFRILRIRHAK